MNDFFLVKTSKDDIKLAKFELKSLGADFSYNFKNIFLCNNFDFRRSAFVNEVFELFFLENMKKYKSYRFLEGLDKLSDKDALFLKEYKVNLKKPEVELALFRIKGRNILFRRIYINDKGFLNRDPKYRPGFHPGACKAKLARIMVNLSGNKSIYDPFCGTGGIIIEGKLMGIDCNGSDIDKNMVDKANSNLEYYGLKRDVLIKDALEFDKYMKCVVTEIPFGKSTCMDRNPSLMIKRFIDVQKNIEKAVIIVPSGYKYDFKDFKVVLDHNMYIHKSLNKRLLVLER
ncbi:MAG: hypothetical protein ACQER9_04655 [Nanobdellota archaeon]